MLVYIVYIVMTIVLSFIYDKQEDSFYKRSWWSIVCLYLILVAGLRHNVGGDTLYYMDDFNYIPKQIGEWKQYILQMMTRNAYMPGWTIFTILCKYCFDSFYMLQLIHAAFVNICIFYLFRKYTQHIFLCALLYGLSSYYFIFNMEIMREAIAIGLCGLSIHFYLQGQKKWFYILAFISLSFHISAIIIFLFPLIKFKKITYKTMLLAIIFSIGLWFASTTLLGYIVEYFSIGDALGDKLINYSGQSSTFIEFFHALAIYMIIQGGIMFFAQNNKIDDKNWMKNYNHIMGFRIIVAIIICGFRGFERFLNYTAIFYLILLTDFIYNYKKQLYNLALTKIVLIITVIFFCARFYMHYYPISNRYRYDLYIPYTSIFNDYVDDSFRKAIHDESLTGSD